MNKDLIRINKKGEFNTAFGFNNNPTIYDEENILQVHKSLINTKIFYSDFEKAKSFIDKNTLVYLDPPYRPLNKTSSFNFYTKEDFNDDSQKRLANFYKEMSERGAKLILSNSEPKNTNLNDNFFDDLYKGFYIDRVLATRIINSNAKKRGKIKELIITNYKSKKNNIQIKFNF